MHLRLILAALAVLSAWPAAAAPDGVIRGSMAVCDPNFPTHCLAPNTSGGLPSTGGTGGGAVYGPNAIGSAPSQPPLFLGYTDASGLMRGVTPLLELPVHVYDLRASSVTLSAAAGSFIDIPLNGDGTVGLRFSGLAASGATVSFFESNDPAVAPTSPINSLNAATGVSSSTRTTDGDTRVAVAGHATLRVQVTTAGTGSIAVSYNVSEIAGIVDVRSPLPPGGNRIGYTPPITGTGSYATPATVSTASAPAVPAAPNGRVFLDLKNESTSQPIACNVNGGTAALNTAGSFTIAPGGDKTWEGSFVPSDQVNCITSAGTAPLTIGAF